MGHYFLIAFSVITIIIGDKSSRHPTLNVASPPQLYSPSSRTQPSVITRLPRPQQGPPFGSNSDYGMLSTDNSFEQHNSLFILFMPTTASQSSHPNLPHSQFHRSSSPPRTTAAVNTAAASASSRTSPSSVLTRHPAPFNIMSPSSSSASSSHSVPPPLTTTMPPSRLGNDPPLAGRPYDREHGTPLEAGGGGRHIGGNNAAMYR